MYHSPQGAILPRYSDLQNTAQSMSTTSTFIYTKLQSELGW